MEKHNRPDLKKWLPTTKKEMKLRGWIQPDVILFSGDAYVDHPSFGAAVIGRLLEAEGLKVVIVPQPNWQDDLRDFSKLGAPRLFFGITAGNMDSMVNHYTANKRLRSNDAYTPGGAPGLRPDYAVRTYSQIIKNMFPEVPVIIGGIEASLRRFTHFDYWSGKLQENILSQSGADLLVYGLGEKVIKQIAKIFIEGGSALDCHKIKQVAYLSQSEPEEDGIWLASHEQCLSSPKDFASNFKIIETESNKYEADRIFQRTGKSVAVVNPPFPNLSTDDLDSVYDLPFTYLPHPKYEKRGAIPAYEMIKFSSNIHRGCFGGCSFCTISAHQGKFISSRSQDSVLKEIDIITSLPDFKGHITDIGGPSANMYGMQGKDLALCRSCKRPSCIFPSPCKNLDKDHSRLSQLYKTVRNRTDVKKVTIGSGIRYDMLMENTPSNNAYKSDLVQYHVSGRLKVAPEHTEPNVLKLMRKPSFELFKTFKAEFDRLNKKFGLRQQLIPYFISSHPGCSGEDMKKLAAVSKAVGIRPEQVQDFTPTPMTLATVIFYTGINPYTGEKVFTATSAQEKLKQKEAFFWHKKTPPKKQGYNKSKGKRN